MKNLSLDNPIQGKLQDIGDLLFAGILWFVCSAPLITIGPASSALYYTVVKVIRHKRGTVFKEFWHSFKDNMGHGIVFTAVYGTIIAANIWFFNQNIRLSSEKNMPVAIGASLIMFFTALTLPYVFPVISRFEDSILKQMNIIILISIGHIPTTLVLAGLLGLAVALIYFIPYLMIVIPAPFAYLTSPLIERTFKKHMKVDQLLNGEETPWFFE